MDVKIRFLEVFCFRWSIFEVGTTLGGVKTLVGVKILVGEVFK